MNETCEQWSIDSRSTVIYIYIYYMQAIKFLIYLKNEIQVNSRHIYIYSKILVSNYVLPNTMQIQFDTFSVFTRFF